MGVEGDEDNVRIGEDLKDWLGSSNTNIVVFQDQPEKEPGVLKEDIKTMTLNCNRIYNGGPIPGT